MYSRLILFIFAFLINLSFSCDVVKNILLNGVDKEVHVKACRMLCYQNQCREDCRQETHEILAGYTGPAPHFYKLCLQDVDQEIHAALIEAWNQHVLFELDILQKTKIHQIMENHSQLLAHESYNEMMDFARRHFIYF